MGCGASSAQPPATEGISEISSVAPLPALWHPPTAAAAPPPSAYAAAPPPPTQAELEAPIAEVKDEVPAASGVQLSFSAPGGTGKSIVKQSTAGGEFGSLLPSQQVMSGVSLGALHDALKGEEQVSEAKFAEVLKSLLAGAQSPPAEAVSALYRAFDVDGSGGVDEKELIAGCQALCAGDETQKLKLAFACFDKDGDG